MKKNNFIFAGAFVCMALFIQSCSTTKGDNAVCQVEEKKRAFVVVTDSDGNTHPIQLYRSNTKGQEVLGASVQVGDTITIMPAPNKQWTQIVSIHKKTLFLYGEIDAVVDTIVFK